MNNVTKLLFFLILLFLTGCNSSSTNEDIFHFKGSYVGDNSAIGAIVNQLQSAENLKGFELSTKEKPYGITLNYDWTESEEKYKETVIYNATFLFALVQNADWIIFRFDNQEYKVTKENLQKWYGKVLSEIPNEDELTNLAKEYLDNKSKVEDLRIQTIS